MNRTESVVPKGKGRIATRLNFYWFILFFLMFHSNVYSQELNNFDKELKRIGTNTALIVHSQAIDEYPIWSPDSDYIGVNIMGKWCRINLNKIKLEKGEWRGGKKIGVPEPQAILEEMQDKEIKEFKNVSKFNEREVKTRNGTKIELKMKEFSTSLILTKNGKQKVFWTSELENCHSLVLSPDEKYVVFICELNGVVIMKLDKF